MSLLVNETMHRSVQLGLKYLLGLDVDQDPRRGTALIERAAKKGDAEAAYLCATLAFYKNREFLNGE